MTRAVAAPNLERVERAPLLGQLVLKASAISLDVCKEHGSMFINLHDRDQRIFACVSLTAKDAAIVLLDGTEKLEGAVCNLEQIVNPN